MHPLYQRLLRRWRRRRLRHHGWVRVEEHPAYPEPLPSFRLFAIVGTWCEADVIAATVHNALTQGCERVYLVDNASLDDTVEQAVKAGAILARSFSTTGYDERLRIKLMTDTVRQVSQETAQSHIWWLWLDGDEFHHGPRGLTIREYLAHLDRRFRVVGSRVFNHFPDSEPAMISGFHPLEFQTLCEEHPMDMCPMQHWKHALQRFDRNGPFLSPTAGFHKASCESRLVEPKEGVFMRHFSYREEATTRQRLSLLCEQEEGDFRRISSVEQRFGESNSSKRFRSLDAVYGQRWAEVDNQRRTAITGVQPRPWTTMVAEEDQAIARWYSRAELEQAVAAWRAKHG